MKHQIDPTVDCVFKAILGSEENKNLLVHFLNAVLSSELKQPITSVSILNPYNDKEHLNDKLSIVDVKARDGNNQLYQIEIQLAYYESLPPRIIYTWANVYRQQLQSGNEYDKLKPTYSIWLMGDNLVKDDDQYLHSYKFRDDTGKLLTAHGGIWLLELKKFHAQHINSEQERWVQFFKDGKTLNDNNGLPEWMGTEEMRQAMNTLRQFSEKEKNYFAYQARQDFIFQQNSIRLDSERKVEQERAEKEAAIQREQAAIQREQAERTAKEAALAEIEELKAKLKNQSL
jgi:predicted transposase/invertase (TIGR01784 family)